MASQFRRYILTGGSAALIDIASFTFLSAGILPIPAAAICSFTLAAVVNYILTSSFVYRERVSLRRFYSFVAVSLIGLIVNVGVTIMATETTPILPIFAKGLGIGVAFLVNFSANTWFVFRTR